MPAKNPRLNIVVEETLYRHVRMLAEKDGVSLSTKVRDLLKQALETQEDILLGHIADQRAATWKDSDSLSHEDVWS
ncbi:MAG: toxin-antitoxin system, antitoxin component [Deltaproteobacteria bacterium]|nr:toxin-antitoxin system, antitoxin component [Deltaproteobacteria bacterium]